MPEGSIDVSFELLKKLGSPKDRVPQQRGDIRLPPGTRIISADNHFSIADDIFYQRFPAAMKDRAPRIWWENGVYQLGFGGKPILTPMLCMIFSEYEMLDGVSRMAQRMEVLDQEGVEKEIVFGNSSAALLFGDDLEARDCITRVYNDYLAELGAQTKGRFNGVAFVNYWDESRYGQSLRNIAALGLKTFLLPLNPGKDIKGEAISYTSPQMDAFWDVVEELDLPVAFHIGENAADGPRGSLGTAFMMNLAPFRKTIGELIFGGVFDRHPKLRVVFYEGGINWIPGMLQDAELIVGAFERMFDWKVQHTPRYYWDNHCYATFITDPLGLRILDEIGPARVMWSHDYPHAESAFGWSWTSMSKIVEAASEDETRAILGGTALKLFKLDD